MRKVGLLALALVASSATSAYPLVECDDASDVGKTALLATELDPPGFPEGIAVAGTRFYVSGPATFGTILKGPSQTLAFDRATGALQDVFAAQGETLLAEHANSCLAFDGEGRLYVLNTQLGVLRIDVASGTQEIYATPFPDLPVCTPLSAGPCSPTLIDAPPLPNDIAFDAAGNAYVTDSLQATIWRIAPGGGAPAIWFQDLRLASPYVGVNGLRIHPDGDRVFFTVTIDLLLQAFVYTLPLVAAPTAADLAVFHKLAPGEAPDGIAFGAAGDLYVTIALPLMSGIVVLGADGAEIRRFMNPSGSLLAPYDSPANLAFDGTGRALVTNHAFVTGLVLPSQFTVVETCLLDAGAPLETPNLGP